MAQKSGNSKKARTPRGGLKRGEFTKNTGNRGAKKNPQTDVALILMGKGMYQARKPFSAFRPS